MGILKQKVKASTLLESIVGLVIILTAFSIALMIYLNVLSSSRNWSKLEGKLILDKEAIEVSMSDIHIDDELKTGSYRVEKKFLTYRNNPKLMHLQLRLLGANNKVITVQDQIIRVR